MDSRSDYIQVMTTFEKRADAERAVERVIGERLAACAQVIGPIHSTYRWEGELVRNAEEWLCLMKTRRALYAELERAIKATHPYTCPEILALPVLEGSPDYLAWMDRELKQNG